MLTQAGVTDLPVRSRAECIERNRQIRDAIMEKLRQRGALSAPQLAAVTRISRQDIRNSLERLRADGLVRRTDKASTSSGLPSKLWELDPDGDEGASPDGAPQVHRAPARQLGLGRDPLVAALYGSANVHPLRREG